MQKLFRNRYSIIDIMIIVSVCKLTEGFWTGLGLIVILMFLACVVQVFVDAWYE